MTIRHPPQSGTASGVDGLAEGVARRLVDGGLDRAAVQELVEAVALAGDAEQSRPATVRATASSPWEALGQESVALAAARDRHTVMGLVLDGAPRLTGLRSALVHRIGADGGRVVTAGPAASLLDRLTTLQLAALTSSAAGAVIADTSADGAVVAEDCGLADLGLRSWVAVPLHDGKPADLLLLADTDRRPCAPDVIGVLQAYASLVASALRTADAFHELKVRSRRDAVTGLEHASSFHEALAAAATDPADGLALLLVDIDNLKQINSRDGHAEGDHVLRTLAMRLDAAVGDAHQAFRVGGDEFGVIATCRSAPEALAVAEELRQSVRTERTTVCIGVSVRTPAQLRDRRSPVDMVSEADLALRAAKRGGRNRVEVYSSDMGEAVLERSRMAADLSKALARDQIRLVYQPIIDLPTRRVLGAEALMRWSTPERGNVPPGLFIPVAEETDEIVELGSWALGEVVRQAVEWDVDRHDMRLSVNVSGLQLSSGYVEQVRDVLAATTLPPHRLVLEITESGLVDDEHRIAQIRGLRRLGVTVAIDDFGTGYSSLSYLRRLPIDVLKIDRSFINELHDERNAAVARTIIELTRVLSLDCVAEGIETPEQVALLTELGCRVVQGYHFARPMEAAEFMAFARDFGVAARDRSA